MIKAKCSLICTVLNEESAVEEFIKSIANQTIYPSEIIIVDGGSVDNTLKKIKYLSSEYKKLNIKVFLKKGNRSIGRNEAVKKSKYEIILITDSGCILDKNWVKIMMGTFSSGVDVVAGYYRGAHRNIFQKSLIPFVLVMPDKLNAENFLPATRSMGIRKKVFQKLGGFDKKLSNNEDYAFAHKIKKQGYNIKFNSKAIVYWQPRSTFKSAFNMFFRFAYGDIEAGIIREKVFWLFYRYILGLYLVLLLPIVRSLYLGSFIVVLLIAYVSWSIYKNFKYVKSLKALFYLPVIQFLADFAVLSGTTKALLNKIRLKDLMASLLVKKILLVTILAYTITCLAQISWGIPDISHPFNYFMDEWHQSQSVRNLFKFGSPNIAGSANGSIFQFFLTGLYLIPFIALKIVNPFVIKSSVLNLDAQHILFIVLRLNTIVFGVLSIIAFYYLLKKNLKINPNVSILMFTFNPMWIMLSGYFKYDIALMFWTLVSLIFIFKYLKEFENYHYFLACLSSSLALSVKLSPFALIPILGLVFLFTPNRSKHINVLIKGIFIYITAFIAFGVIDILLGKGSLNEYLSSTLSRTPDFNAMNYLIPNKIWPYMLSDLFPTLFGHAFYLLGGFGLIVFFGNFLLLKGKVQYIYNKRVIIVFFITFILFTLSLVPLKLDASNNRVLILIPFVAYFFGYLIKFLYNKFNNLLVLLVVIFFLLLQLIEVFSWVSVKVLNDPRQSSSTWILKHIPKHSEIGIQNIPIYQGLPDVVVNEYYRMQYKIKDKYNYKYKIINLNDKENSKYIILTNVNIELKYKLYSETKEIQKKIINDRYVKIKEFKPDFRYLFLFTNELNYYMAAIVQSPVTISIYEKSK